MTRTSLFAKIILSASLLPFGLLTPILEIGPTHVFNPDWPGHARLHEVWQLVTHSALALMCLWLTWRTGQVRLAALIALLISAGFLAAYVLSPLYGGTMKHSDGTELSIGGINSAVAIMVAAALGKVGVLIAAARQSSTKHVEDAERGL
jgi:hypothetical protein